MSAAQAVRPVVVAMPRAAEMFIAGLAGGHCVLAVCATGDGPPRWSVSSVSKPQRLVLDLSAKRHKGFWAVQLDAAVRDASGPIVLIAEGFACLAIVRWAQLSPRSYFKNIAGAVLLSPMSIELEQGPMLRDMYPSPAMRLPFPSAVVEHETSPSITRVLELAATWESTFIQADDISDVWQVGARQPFGASFQVPSAQHQKAGNTAP